MAACKKDQCVMLEMAKNILMEWYNSRGTSVQLDGKSEYTPSRDTWITFPYAKATYKLHGDTRAEAVKEFLDLYTQLNGVGVLVKEKNTLRLATGNGAEGWYCYKV